MASGVERASLVAGWGCNDLQIFSPEMGCDAVLASYNRSQPPDRLAGALAAGLRIGDLDPAVSSHAVHRQYLLQLY